MDAETPFAALVAQQLKTRPATPWHTLWIFGGPGDGKTRFALGAARSGPIAYIGTESSAEDYIGDPEFPGFTANNILEVRDEAKAIQAVDAAIASKPYAIIFDQLTDYYEWEVNAITKKGENGPYVPMNAWTPMFKRHKDLLRKLRDAPCHKILISQVKEITAQVKDRDGSLRTEILGYKPDGQKKDGHFGKLWMRMHRKGNEFLGEVYKDRILGDVNRAGTIIKEPKAEMWLKAGKAA